MQVFFQKLIPGFFQKLDQGLRYRFSLNFFYGFKKKQQRFAWKFYSGIFWFRTENNSAIPQGISHKISRKKTIENFVLLALGFVFQKFCEKLALIKIYE